MSAIYGVINKNGKPVAPEMVRQMKAALEHRAKNGAAEVICDNAAFGFCHLIVYTNQENECLPLESGDLLFTGNVHLHNREELVNKLGIDPKQYAATPDSYLVLKAFEKWGAGCVHHLDGEYVYAIWNKVSKELFISNDHIGYNALYYYDTPEQFIFCSEIKGIEAVKKTTNYFDGNSLIYYTFRSGNPEATYNKEIKNLCGGNILTLKTYTLCSNRYWKVEATGKYSFQKDTGWHDCLREIFCKAVENRLNSAVPVGITLSGGLDSSSIACILSALLKKKNQPLYSFSSVPCKGPFDEKQDERSYMEIMNRHCGNIIQTNVCAEDRGPFDNIEKTLAIDEMIPGYFHYMNEAILQAAHEKSIRILYTGYGGDFWTSAKAEKAIWLLLSKGNYRKAFSLLRQTAVNENRSAGKVLYREIFIYTRLYHQLKKLKRSFSKTDLFKTGFLQQFPLPKRDCVLLYISDIINEGWAGIDMARFDKRNAFYAAASATPFFDKSLMEFMADVPLYLFRYGGHQRSLMRHAMEGILPPEIQWRTTKSPYVTDHFKRFCTDGPLINSFLNSAEYDFIYDKYFEKRNVAEQVAKANSTLSAAEQKILKYHICYLGTSALAMKHMKQKNHYYF